MKKFLFVLLALAIPALAQAQVDIAIEHGGNWTTVAHTTSSDENTAGSYYQEQEVNGLCSDQGLSAGCSEAEYDTECAKAETPACETFYARTAEGGKLWFMAKVIEANLTVLVGSSSIRSRRATRRHSPSLTNGTKTACWIPVITAS